MKHTEDTGGCEHWTTDDDRLLLAKTSEGLYRFPVAPAPWRLLPEFVAAIEDAISREQRMTDHSPVLQTAALFRRLFGHDFTPEQLRLIAEVMEKAIFVRDRWRKLMLFPGCLDDFCKAVDALEEGNKQNATPLEKGFTSGVRKK